MIYLILSIGAVYAFIPIIIIIILIIAARGSTGKDFFAIFGVTTLINSVRGIGGGGAGKGISGRSAAYRANTVATKDAAKAAGGVFIADTAKKTEYLDQNLFQGNLYKKNRAQRTDYIENMYNVAGRNAVYDMLKKKGYTDSKLLAMSDEQLKRFATENLTLAFVSAYFAKNIKGLPPLGEPPPPESPKARGYYGKVAMSTEFYDRYKKARSSAGGRGAFSIGRARAREMNLLLKSMSDDQLRTLLQSRGIDAAGKSRDALIGLAASGLTLEQIRGTKEGKGSGDNVFRGDKTGKDDDQDSAAPANTSGSSDPKINILEQMSDSEIRNMMKHYGRADVPGISHDNLVGYAYSYLSPQQIREYFNNIRGKS